MGARRNLESQEAALHGSSYYDLPGLLRWFTANIGIHHIHHLNSRIPYYRLPQVLRDHPDLAGIGRLTLLESSGACGSCCGTRASDVWSLSARCVGTVLRFDVVISIVRACTELFERAQRKLVSWSGGGCTCAISVKGGHVADKQLPPEVASSTCPECGTEMVIVRIKPILFGGSLEELSLACKRSCGLTKKINIKRD